MHTALQNVYSDLSTFILFDVSETYSYVSLITLRYGLHLQNLHAAMYMLPRIHVDSKYMISLMFAGKYM